MQQFLMAITVDWSKTKLNWHFSFKRDHKLSFSRDYEKKTHPSFVGCFFVPLLKLPSDDDDDDGDDGEADDDDDSKMRPPPYGSVVTNKSPDESRG